MVAASRTADASHARRQGFRATSQWRSALCRLVLLVERNTRIPAGVLPGGSSRKSVDPRKGNTVTELQRFQDKQWSLIVAKAWSDDEFKGLLLSNPQAVLREHGIDAPDDVRVNVVDDSDMMSYLTLPPSPTSDL